MVTRAGFERRLGHSFANVRIHADARAAASARELGARAFTVGSDIVFATGEYEPATLAGQTLLAHELAHVAAHTDAPRGAISVSRQRSPTAPTPQAKPTLQRGKITYQPSSGFTKSKLNAKNAGGAAWYVLATEVGMQVVEWLASHGVNVTVLFIADKSELPGGSSDDAHPAGFTQPVDAKHFNVYVIAGQSSYSFEDVKGGGKLEVVRCDESPRRADEQAPVDSHRAASAAVRSSARAAAASSSCLSMSATNVATAMNPVGRSGLPSPVYAITANSARARATYSTPAISAPAAKYSRASIGAEDLLSSSRVSLSSANHSRY